MFFRLKLSQASCELNCVARMDEIQPPSQSQHVAGNYKLHHLKKLITSLTVQV